MAVKDSLHSVKISLATSGTGEDLLGFNSFTYYIKASKSCDISVVLAESDDNTTYTDIAETDVPKKVIGSLSADSATELSFGYKGIARYLKATVTLSDSATGTIVLVKAMPALMPTM